MKHKLIIFTALFGALFMLQSCNKDEDDNNATARAYLNNTQTIPVGVVKTKVLFDTENYDTNNNFDPATSRFTASIAGYYQVNGSVEYQNPTEDAQQYVSLIVKNGDIVNYVAENVALSGSTLNISCPISDIVYLAIGDYLELFTVHSSSNPRILNFPYSSSNFLSISLIK